MINNPREIYKNYPNADNMAQGYEKTPNNTQNRTAYINRL